MHFATRAYGLLLFQLLHEGEGILRRPVHLIDKENVRSVAVLADKFGVSSAAMLYRVKELNYKTKE